MKPGHRVPGDNSITQALALQTGGHRSDHWCCHRQPVSPNQGRKPQRALGHSYIWVRSPIIVTNSVNRAFFLWQRTQRLSTEGHCGQTILTELVNQATATKKETFSAVTKQEKIEIPVVWCGIPVARINFHSSQKPKQQVTWLLRLINVFFAFLQA